MNIRSATRADADALRILWEAYEREVEEPAGFDPETWDEQWAVLQRSFDGGSVHLAEDGGKVVAVVHVLAPDHGAAHVEWAYVVPEHRREGLAKTLLHECVRESQARGAATVSLQALPTNEPALTVWRRLGFETVEYFMAIPLDTLEQQLARDSKGPSHASTHVLSDDRASVDRAVAEFVPRLEAPDVHAAANGWIRIADPLFDEDRDAQSRFAQDLSERLGAVSVALANEGGSVVRYRLYDNGRMVDEYLSVPTWYGSLSMGDELALAANPTLVARLTGALPDDVRSTARNAPSPSELPKAADLYRELAALMGLEA